MTLNVFDDAKSTDLSAKPSIEDVFDGGISNVESTVSANIRPLWMF